MPPIFVLADLYAQASLHRVAFSALPDAPVQPYVEPTKRAWHFTKPHRRPTRRPARRPAYVIAATGGKTDCYST